MKRIHVANIFFEKELEGTFPGSLLDAIESSRLSRILQYLPALYAEAEDFVLVLKKPEFEWKGPQINWILYSDLKKLPSPVTICPWGASKLVEQFCHQKGFNYEAPSYAFAQLLQSKAYGPIHWPDLSSGTLIFNKSDLRSWLDFNRGDRVLKSCYGTSASGHYFLPFNHLSRLDSALAFCQKQWDLTLPVIAEIWHERLFDFSTQWKIDQSGRVHYLGATQMENKAKGAWDSTVVAPELNLFGALFPFLEEQKQVVEPVLQEIAMLGYRGYLGIDAFVYRKDMKLKLAPLVELNARKTMGLAALFYALGHCPEGRILLSQYRPLDAILSFPLAAKSLYVSHLQ